MSTPNFETDRKRERWLDEIVALPEGAYLRKVSVDTLKREARRGNLKIIELTFRRSVSTVVTQYPKAAFSHPDFKRISDNMRRAAVTSTRRPLIELRTGRLQAGELPPRRVARLATLRLDFLPGGYHAPFFLAL